MKRRCCICRDKLGHVIGALWTGLLVLVTACDDDVGQMLRQAVGQAEAAQGEEMQLSGKLDPYIRCVAEHSPRAFEARRHYLSWIEDAETGPRCEQPPRMSVYTLASVRSCLDEIARAHSLMPALPRLEKAGIRYAKALQRLATSLKQARAFYDKANARGEACARARALHHKLINSWDALSAADSQLQELIEQHNARLLHQELRRTLEQHGKGLRFFHKRTQIEAARVLRVIRRHERTARASLESLTTAVAEFEATASGLRKVAEKTPAATRNAFFWDAFIAQTGEFIHAIKEFAGARTEGRAVFVADGKRRASETGHRVPGSYAKVDHEYQELFRLSTSLEFTH